MSEIHQQNSENRQTPVLTLDPSSVAKEKVQLEETTQQLEAMAQAAPSANAAAQAASEAVKQMDTTMLTEEDKKSIEEFVKKIDVNNSDHVLLYGADAQKKIADFSDSALATIRTKDTGEVGDMLVNLVNEIKGFSAAAEKPSGIKGLFWNAQKAVTDMQTKYDKVDANVDTIASQLENHQVQLLKDVSMFNHLYDMNTQFSSINGLLGIPFQSAYTASKHALEGYAECLAMETADFGIQVCLVEPGDHRGGSSHTRLHAKNETNTVYQKAYENTCAIIHHDEENGLFPDRLGRKIVRNAQRRHMRFRLRVAKPDQHLAVLLHTLFPASLNRKILCSYYRAHL